MRDMLPSAPHPKTGGDWRSVAATGISTILNGGRDVVDNKVRCQRGSEDIQPFDPDLGSTANRTSGTVAQQNLLSSHADAE